MPVGTTGFQVFGCNVESDNGWFYSSQDGGLNPAAQTFPVPACVTAGGLAGEPVDPVLAQRRTVHRTVLIDPALH